MIADLLLSMRPKQWIKNILIFSALIFSQNFSRPEPFHRTLAVFFLFCLLSGGVYLLNDVIDRERDRNNPAKKNRPVASGRLPVPVALGAGILFSLLAAGCAFTLGAGPGAVFLAYFLLQIAYSCYLKNVVILDVFAVAAGFVLRVVAGAAAIGVPVSSWLYICIILLSLFLALGKRRQELEIFSSAAADYRKVLSHYSLYLLDAMISIVTSATLLAYILYTMSEETVRKFHTTNLKYTVPFVLYGIFRYLYLIHKKQQGGAPEKALLGDLPLIIDVLLYGIAVGIILYS